MHIILYKHTSHYIHYQLSQNTHSQSQTVAIMTALKNSLILITLCLGLAAAQEDAGEARLLFSNYTSGISNTILWKTLLRGEFWNSENPRPPETDNSKLHHLRPGLPDSGWGSPRHRLWLPHHRVPHLPEPVPVTVQIIQWWWKREKKISKYEYETYIPEPSTNLRSLLGADLNILGLVTKAIKVYKAINDEDEE